MVKNYILAWIMTFFQLFILEVVIWVFEGNWGSMERLAFCIGLIALFEVNRIRQKL